MWLSHPRYRKDMLYRRKSTGETGLVGCGISVYGADRNTLLVGVVVKGKIGCGGTGCM